MRVTRQSNRNKLKLNKLSKDTSYHDTRNNLSFLMHSVVAVTKVTDDK